MSRNTLKKGSANLLILKMGDRYIGLCRELGFIEEGESQAAVEKRLVSSIRLVLKTVAGNPQLEPSLNVGLPLKYRAIYWALPLLVAFSSITRRFYGDVHIVNYPISRLLHG